MRPCKLSRPGKPRLLRYGKGSPYFDIQLPCGSGLDVLVEPFENESLIQDMRGRMERREPFALQDRPWERRWPAWKPRPLTVRGPQSHPEGKGFVRVYTPPLRCVIIGSSPIAVKLAAVLARIGFETHFYAPDVENLPALPTGVGVHSLLPCTKFPADRWTAAVLAFHDHEKELPAFRDLLKGPRFFLSAIGSRKAHAARQLALESACFSLAEIARIQSPAGLIHRAKIRPAGGRVDPGAGGGGGTRTGYRGLALYAMKVCDPHRRTLPLFLTLSLSSQGRGDA